MDKGFGENTKVDVVVRPEDIKITREEDGMIKGIIKSVTFKGVHYEMIAEANGIEWIIHSTAMSPVNSRVGLNIYPNDIQIMEKVVKE